MKYEEILCELLECGELDIAMLKDCEYDFYDIAEECRGFTDKMTFQDILLGAICIYQRNIQEKIDERIDELSELIEELEETEETDTKEYNNYVTEKNNLLTLCASEDIEYFINYIDTHLYIIDTDKKKIYNKYLESAIDEENSYIGFVALYTDV